MKLRNKKTGEIKDFGNLQVYAEIENTDESQLLGNFDSFKQILEYYEDYIPKEPLIKDPKIRKAVRAWAEANGIERVWHECASCWLRGNGLKIELENEVVDLEQRNYTIAELCGEEE